MIVRQRREPVNRPLLDVARPAAPGGAALGRPTLRTILGETGRDAIVVSDVADEALRCRALPQAFVIPSLALAYRALLVNGRQVILEFGVYR